MFWLKIHSLTKSEDLATKEAYSQDPHPLNINSQTPHRIVISHFSPPDRRVWLLFIPSSTNKVSKSLRTSWSMIAQHHGRIWNSLKNRFQLHWPGDGEKEVDSFMFPSHPLLFCCVRGCVNLQDVLPLQGLVTPYEKQSSERHGGSTQELYSQPQQYTQDF